MEKQDNITILNDGKKSQRDGNFEVLRIVSIIMVVFWHLNVHGGFFKETLGVNHIIFSIIGVLTVISVNLFVMITSYFLVEKKIKPKKLLSLWCEILFYSVTIYLVFLACGWYQFEWKDLLIFIPILSTQYWFASSYFIFYLIIPFLNAMISNISQKQHGLLCLGILVISILNIVFNFSVCSFNSGYSAIWFACVFVIIAYLKKYQQKDYPWWVYLSIFIVVTLISYFVGYSYSNPLTLIASLCIFMMFKKIKIENQKVVKIISCISSTTFGIYLLHDNAMIRSKLYSDFLNVSQFYNSNFAVLIFIGYAVLIFVICMIIEFLRQRLFKLVKKLYNKIKCKKMLQS